VLQFGRRAEAEVDFAAKEGVDLELRVEFSAHDLDLGRLLAEATERRREEREDAVLDVAEHETVGASLFRSADRRLRRFRAGDEVFPHLGEHPAGAREAHPTRVSVKEHRPKIGLQARDALAERRLADPKFFGGAVKALELGDGEERVEERIEERHER
jgi:hypothetical protein